MTTIQLTPAEDLICRYKIQGFQVKEIADILKRSPDTLRVHIRHIHEKIQVNNEVEVVVWYIENVLGINIKKMVQVIVLMAILAPGILTDDTKILRTSRTARTCRTSRNRRSEDNNYQLSI